MASFQVTVEMLVDVAALGSIAESGMCSVTVPA
ncbi:hypothetical protein F4559_004135 [Saccharothrix violaceirubra]|uniref:Uncharacterized protein n=1 Tax=Saccharothrix violaceirubra TaxID=413306 RepID=A0A7W7T5P4_9PSEU|nr:hypothetical protein [Saccharothrix violaceirubra]